MGSCHGRLLHTKVKELLEGSASADSALDSHASLGRARVGRWALTFFSKCCDLEWDDGGDTMRIVTKSLECSVGHVGDLPSDTWSTYVDVTHKLEKCLAEYRRVTVQRRLLPSVLNERVLHTIALWLVQTALKRKDMTVVSGLKQSSLDEMNGRVIEASRARLINAVVSKMLSAKEESAAITLAVARLKAQDPATFMDHTADVWSQAGDIARCATSCGRAEGQVHASGRTKTNPSRDDMQVQQMDQKKKGQAEKSQGKTKTKTQGQGQGQGVKQGQTKPRGQTKPQGQTATPQTQVQVQAVNPSGQTVEAQMQVQKTPQVQPPPMADTPAPAPIPNLSPPSSPSPPSPPPTP